MSYSDKRERLQEIRAKYREAKAERDAYIERRNTIDSDVNTAYDKYIRMQAKKLTGDATKKEATKAENAYLTLKSERDELDKQIELSERVLSIVSDKMQTVKADFVQDARKHHRDKLKPHFKKIDKALETINSEINALNGYRRELQSDHVSDSILEGINWHSKAVITKKNLAGTGYRDFITHIND